MDHQTSRSQTQSTRTQLRISGSTYTSLYTSVRNQLQGHKLLINKLETHAHETQVLAALVTIPAHFKGVFEGMSTSRIEGILLHFAHKCIHNARRGALYSYRRTSAAPASSTPASTAAERRPEFRHVEEASPVITGYTEPARRQIPSTASVKTESSVVEEDYLAFQLATYGRPNLNRMDIQRSKMGSTPINTVKSSLATI